MSKTDDLEKVLNFDFVEKPVRAIITGAGVILFSVFMYALLIWIFKRKLFADVEYLFIMAALALLGLLLAGIGIYYLSKVKRIHYRKNAEKRGANEAEYEKDV